MTATSSIDGSSKLPVSPLTTSTSKGHLKKIEDVAQPKIGFCGKMCEFLKGLVTSKLSNVIVITAAIVLLFLFVSNLAGWIAAIVGTALLAARFMPLGEPKAADSNEQQQLPPVGTAFLAARSMPLAEPKAADSNEQQRLPPVETARLAARSMPLITPENQELLKRTLQTCEFRNQVQEILKDKAVKLKYEDFQIFCAIVITFYNNLEEESLNCSAFSDLDNRILEMFENDIKSIEDSAGTQSLLKRWSQPDPSSHRNTL